MRRQDRANIFFELRLVRFSGEADLKRRNQKRN